MFIFTRGLSPTKIHRAKGQKRNFPRSIFYIQSWVKLIFYIQSWAKLIFYIQSQVKIINQSYKTIVQIILAEQQKPARLL